MQRTRHIGWRATAVTLLVLVGLGCHEGGAASQAQKAPPARPAAPATPTVSATPFDGARALEHVRKLVGFGPRPAGSPAIAAARKYIASELAAYGLTVREQAFTAQTPAGKVDMVNVVGELPGASPAVLVLGSHYDTKRTPASFIGANDAGSSTGALLEVARVMAESAKSQKPALTVQFVFFDGEEAVNTWTEEDSLYGSRHFVEKLEEAGTIDNVRAMVLLDMIGDRDLNIKRELGSTKTLTDIIWQTAASLGYGRHFPNEGQYIDDDHRPFLEAGVPAVDLIDFNYGTDERSYGPGGPDNAYWHTAQDTLDKVSAESLKVVGDVVVASVPKIMASVR
jgi:Zn-dependent M28 family amino/carboxypeptidase